MRIGETWAYREKAYTAGAPVLPVEILQFGPPRSQKVRIRFLAGEYPGLDQWVPAVRLRVPWDEAAGWLEDEKRFAAARDAFPDAYQSLEHQAAWEVSYAYPGSDDVLIGDGQHEGATITIRDIEQVARDLDLDVQELLSEPLAFVNRFGHYVGPWPVALRVAHRVAEVYTEGVLAKLAEDERELRLAAVRGSTVELVRGEPWHIPAEREAERLREKQPLFQLIRSWCGQDKVDEFDKVHALQAEVERLRELVQRAARSIDELGHPRIAGALLKELRPPSGDDRDP